MNSVLGLDIGSHTIKLVELRRTGSNPVLLAAGAAPSPPKALTSNIPADQESVAVAIKKLLRDTGAKSRDVNIALPESQVFTRVIEMPPLTEREIKSAIQWEAEQYVPLPLDQVTIDFSVLRDAKETGTTRMDVLLVASPKALIEKYVNILEAADLNALGAETEIIAASRALVRSAMQLRSVMIVSLGAQTSDLAILRRGIITFTRSIGAGGEALSRALSQGFDFNISQAEEFKRAYGLEKDKLAGKLVAVIKPVMDTIIIEIKRAMAFYQEKYKEERVEVVLTTGGTARLPGLIAYMAEALGVEVQLGNPWVGIVRDSRFAVLDNEGATFSVAMGLALR